MKYVGANGRQRFCLKHRNGDLLPSRDHIVAVQRLFPGWNKQVAGLALRDETFCDLVEKYGRSLEALNLLEVRNRPHDVERMYDYRRLIKELESELKYELLASCNPDQTRHRAHARKPIVRR